jgi:hypothetical protein
METPISDDMSLDQAVPRKSNYLTKDECGEGGLVVTCAGLAMAELDDDGRTENRPILKFLEDVKPMVLNQTNKELLKVATGETTAGGIKGKKIIVYNDPSIMFGGKITGGIRIKKVPTQDAPAAAPAWSMEDVPF